jgi:putative membrane-bound dehydrogenase-like protein
MSRWQSVAVLLALGCAPAAAQPPLPANGLAPAAAVGKMQLPPGFQVTVFAAEPDLVQPIAFCIDERGRVWVAENLDYVNRRSNLDEGRSRISVYEDTDGDGTFDVKKVVVEKLFFPSGLEIGFGGLWVGSPPNLLFIPLGPDDKPTGPPEVLLDGWGMQDRHETINSFIWGPDGWLYGCQGVFTRSEVGAPGTPADRRVTLDCGWWRYHPVKRRFEVFAEGGSNQWGIGFDDHGQAFASACVIPHLWHVIQGGRYQRQAGPHALPYTYADIQTIADHKHPSAHGGARVYLADNFPAAYRHRLFMGNIHQHAVLTDILDRRGSGFVGRHGDEFLAANDNLFIGFNLEIGPEGGLYVIDWYDRDICGNAIDKEQTGRLYRVTYGDVKSPVGMDLARRSDAELIALHLHANDWYGRQARRLLQERAARGALDAATIPGLSAILAEHPEPSRRLRALWSLHAVGGLKAERLLELLGHENEYLRAWAIQLLCEDRSPPLPGLGPAAAAARPAVGRARRAPRARRGRHRPQPAAHVLVCHGAVGRPRSRPRPRPRLLQRDPQAVAVHGPPAGRRSGRARPDGACETSADREAGCPAGAAARRPGGPAGTEDLPHARRLGRSVRPAAGQRRRRDPQREPVAGTAVWRSPVRGRPAGADGVGR